MHTTVVPLLGGTTTVVLCAGGLGLPLLMQPASIDARIIKLDRYFIVLSRGIVVFLTYAHSSESPRAATAAHPA